jgi:hypothetical protein
MALRTPRPTPKVWAQRLWRIDRVRPPGQIDEVTLKTIKEMRDAAPFKPFELHLADGRALTVATADHLFFLPKNREFLVVLPDDGFRFVDLEQVVSAGRGPKRARAH